MSCDSCATQLSLWHLCSPPEDTEVQWCHWLNWKVVGCPSCPGGQSRPCALCWQREQSCGKQIGSWDTPEIWGLVLKHLGNLVDVILLWCLCVILIPWKTLNQLKTWQAKCLQYRSLGLTHFFPPDWTCFTKGCVVEDAPRAGVGSSLSCAGIMHSLFYCTVLIPDNWEYSKVWGGDTHIHLNHCGHLRVTANFAFVLF